MEIPSAINKRGENALKNTSVQMIHRYEFVEDRICGQETVRALVPLCKRSPRRGGKAQSILHHLSESNSSDS